MNTVSNEGLLNNYATEPQVYYAEFPSPEQQRDYALQGAIAAMVVAVTFAISLSIS